MTNTMNAPIQLELALPAAPDTTPMHAVVEARLETITTRALPAARARRQFLATVWASDDANAVEVFIDERIPFRCHPTGVDRVAAAAANEAALLTEAVALHDLQRALEMYDAGGRLVTGADHEFDVPHLVTSDTTSTEVQPRTLRSLKERAAHVRAVRAYTREVEDELRAAVRAGRAEEAVALKAERLALSVHLKAVTGAVRRRARAADRSRSNDDRARRIA